jgi:hypothetical protein
MAQMNQKIMKKGLLWLAAGITVIGLSSCIPLAAGAAAGYIAHDEGYRLQSPVTR